MQKDSPVLAVELDVDEMANRMPKAWLLHVEIWIRSLLDTTKNVKLYEIFWAYYRKGLDRAIDWSREDMINVEQPRESSLFASSAALTKICCFNVL